MSELRPFISCRLNFRHDLAARRAARWAKLCREHFAAERMLARHTATKYATPINGSFKSTSIMRIAPRPVMGKLPKKVEAQSSRAVRAAICPGVSALRFGDGA
jgi:hypothetical protein